MELRGSSVKVTQFVVIMSILAGVRVGTSDRAEPETDKFFQCVGKMESDRVRLYLGLDNLVVDCRLQGESGGSARQQQSQLELYTSAGLLPTLALHNTTDHAAFSFRLVQNESLWRVNVPRHNITINTGPAPVDQWYVEFSMFSTKDSVLDTLKGTLLDVAREPILQWTIGEELSSAVVGGLLPGLAGLRVTQSPCASDVAVSAPLFTPGGHTAGVILSVSRSAFTSQARWFNATQSLCSLINQVCVSGCAGISLVDVKLTNTHLFLLTNRGLFISQDLLDPATGPLNFTLLFLPALAQMDYSSTTLWFASQCVTDGMYFSDDIISLISNEGEGENLNSRCVYSEYPFKKWWSCQAAAADLQGNAPHRYLSFLHDRTQHTALLLAHTQQGAAMVSVLGVRGEVLQRRTKFPPVLLDFLPRGLFLLDHHVFLYGSEVWASSDRGSSFSRVFSVAGGVVVDALRCRRSRLLLFVTDHGHLYAMKTGLTRFAWLDERLSGATALLCDHMGVLMALQLNPNQPSGFSYRTINVPRLVEKHEMGFDRPLALQYTTDHTVLLHEHAPISSQSAASTTDHRWSSQSEASSLSRSPTHFSPDHTGKVITFREGGRVVITEVYQSQLRGFVGVAVGEILEPIRGASLGEEPIQSYDLLVEKVEGEGLNVTLQLLGRDAFGPAHVGQTVVAPGYSSYLVMGVLPGGRGVATPTMPALVAAHTRHAAGDWLLFRAGGRGSWGMREGPCRHALQSLDGLRDDALVRINVHERLTFTFTAFISHSLSMVYHRRLMRVTLTDPLAMRVTVAHAWDATNNHRLTLTATSHLCRKTSTTVTVCIPEASLLCSTSSFTFTLQNSCPAGLAIAHGNPQPITDHAWLHGDPLDHHGNKRLFDLPVNYRPPSQLGVLIPTSDNIYNADPSRPRPRQHYPVSKSSGRYKQCAGQQTAEGCGCTNALRLSPLTTNSDCRQRVLRVAFPVCDLSIPLFLRRPNHVDQPLRSPYFVTVTEVNNRTNWKVTGTHATHTMARIRQHLRGSLTLYNPEGLQISLYGSELFHFRISVIPGVVLCDLQEEVQIYVDQPPLAFPSNYLINTVTAVALGNLLLAGFLLKHNGVAMPTVAGVQNFLKRHRSTVAPE